MCIAGSQNPLAGRGEPMRIGMDVNAPFSEFFEKFSASAAEAKLS
jgi:hypothetical protein